MTRYEHLTNQIDENLDHLSTVYSCSHEANELRGQRSDLLLARRALTVGEAQEEVIMDDDEDFLVLRASIGARIQVKASADNIARALWKDGWRLPGTDLTERMETGTTHKLTGGPVYECENRVRVAPTAVDYRHWYSRTDGHDEIQFARDCEEQIRDGKERVAGFWGGWKEALSVLREGSD